MGGKGDGRQCGKRLVPATAPDGEPLSGQRGAEQIAATPSAKGWRDYGLSPARKAAAVVEIMA